MSLTKPNASVVLAYDKYIPPTDASRVSTLSSAPMRAVVQVTASASIHTLLAFGCPVPAIVAAFGLDERTVAAGG